MASAMSDPEAVFSALYERFYGRVRAYAARRAGADAADEIAAETFAVAWRRVQDVPSEPLPWLYGVARNILARYRARSARERSVQHALRFECAPGGAAEQDWPELWDAWASLGDGDREVLALIAWEELSVRDAAAVLGISPPVLSVRLHRARRRLERQLKAEPGMATHLTHVSGQQVREPPAEVR
jgi:RNA polymerase sigma-70 factor, ECF subfamily